MLIILLSFVFNCYSFCSSNLNDIEYGKLNINITFTFIKSNKSLIITDYGKNIQNDIKNFTFSTNPLLKYSNCIEYIQFNGLISSISPLLFYNFINLKYVNLNKNLQVIHFGAFDSCSNLLYINLIDTNLSLIDENAFNHCKNLIRLDLPSSLIRINQNAFSGCFNLNYISYYGYNNPSIISLKNKNRLIGNIFIGVNTSIVHVKSFYNDLYFNSLPIIKDL